MTVCTSKTFAILTLLALGAAPGCLQGAEDSESAPLTMGEDDGTDPCAGGDDDSTDGLLLANRCGDDSDGDDDGSGGAGGGGAGGSGDGGDDGEADLPYNMKLDLGDSFRLTDAFLEKGPPPAEVLSVTMEGSTWRLAELQADEVFVVTQDDCDHLGNKGVGRDRIEVSWRNADGSIDADHMSIRYCH